MFNKSNNKVKFQDQQIDDYVLENSVLKSKLQSKLAALSIMNKELDKCSMERDRFKVLVEQLTSKKSVQFPGQESTNLYRQTQANMVSGGELLATTREQNNMLKLEVENLRSRLEDATGDIIALRKQLQIIDNCGSNKLSPVMSCSSNDYEQLVQELEKIHKKYQQLQLDYRATLDEKEEIIQDRDYYKNKVQRLHHQISYVMNRKVKENDNTKPIVDLDALMAENKYLHERITQLQVEKELIKRNLTKYKTLLENRNKTESLNIKNKKGFIDVMTQKQVREYLENYSKCGLKRTSAAELGSLCLGLLEAVGDKSTALQHQRKTNQILANRITDLEKTLESWCEGQKCIPIFPSAMLIEEFTDSTNDECKTPTEKEKHDTDSEKSENNISVDSDDKYDCELGTKTVLPADLEELVREAMAEIKTENGS